MSYNILYGAGVDRQWDSALPVALVGRDRLPELLSFVKQADPDILGIQEANGWDSGTPMVIEQAARELGMHYFLAKTPSRFHIGLFTKLEILETQNLSSDVGRQGALRAKLLAPDGQPLYVFVVHLDPSSPDARLCEVDTLLRQMQLNALDRALLLGDMNFQASSREYSKLKDAGWQPVTIEKSWGIDQIWISPSTKWTTTSWYDSLSLPSGISDHTPIGAEINVYTTPSTISVPTLVQPTPTMAPPVVLSDTLTSTQVLRFDGFDDPCASTRWNSRWTTERITNGRLEIGGEPSWQAFVSRYMDFSEGQGALLRFQFTKGSEFGIHFDNTAWNTDLYRRFGIETRDDNVRSIVWEGASRVKLENLSGNLDIVPDTWYNLLLAVGQNEELVVQVWDPAKPVHRSFFRKQMGEEWTALPWVFEIGANKGKVLVDDFTEVSFSQFK